MSSAEMTREQFAESLVNPNRWKWKVLIGTPSLGVVRIEWANSMMNTVMPMNWSASRIVHPVRVLTPLRYHVAEAQNVIVKHLLDAPQWEYLLLLEDDVLAPPNLMTRLHQWISHGVYPMVSGLYHLKSDPREPMTFRGRGNGAWEGWKKGPSKDELEADLPEGIKAEQVALCDGVPTGCLLISSKILRVAWDASPETVLRQERIDGTIAEIRTREVFKTVREAGVDPAGTGYYARYATSDLDFCDRAIAGEWFAKAGFEKAGAMSNPMPVDLAIACGHIDLETGRVF